MCIRDRIEEDFETLLSLAREYQTMAEFLDEVDRLSGVASVDPNRQEMPEAVTLMTIHRSKGLEYQAVHLCNASRGMLPHAMALQQDNEREGMEEERRLAFVAMSRAKQELVAYYQQVDDTGRESGPSPFLGEAGLL